MVAGLETPTAGKITIGDKEITYEKPYKRPVNTVFQNYALFPHLSISDNVAFGLKRRGIKDTAKTVADMLDLVELTAQASKRPQQLSGGQQQRVALARALINQPEVLLLDEPLGALDLKLRRAMQLELKRIQTEVGLTFVHVTHDQEEAMTMADTIAVMNAGRIEQMGSPADLYDNPATTFVANFLGQSNLIAGHVVGEDTLGGHPVVTVDMEGTTVSIPKERSHVTGTKLGRHPSREGARRPGRRAARRPRQPLHRRHHRRHQLHRRLHPVHPAHRVGPGAHGLRAEHRRARRDGARHRCRLHLAPRVRLPPRRESGRQRGRRHRGGVMRSRRWLPYA